MSATAMALGLVAALFVAMVMLLEVGRRLAIRRPPGGDEGDKVGIAAVDGAVFGLMGLLLAFTFSGALTRWDTRHAHIREELNAIGTAYMRLDLLPPAAQPALKQAFRSYIDARLAVYSHLDNPDAPGHEQTSLPSLQAQIWRDARAACGAAADRETTSLLVIPSLNDMFDAATTRDLYVTAHPPVAMYLALGVVVLASSLLAGYGMVGTGRVDRVHMICYALMVTLSVYVTLEIEFPRVGLVRIDAADQAYVEMREWMK